MAVEEGISNCQTGRKMRRSEAAVTQFFIVCVFPQVAMWIASGRDHGGLP